MNNGIVQKFTSPFTSAPGALAKVFKNAMANPLHAIVNIIVAAIAYMMIQEGMMGQTYLNVPGFNFVIDYGLVAIGALAYAKGINSMVLGF